MKRNGFYRPTSLSEALAWRETERVMPYAGGTDLMIAPGVIPFLFLGDLPELKQIYEDDSGLHIGPSVTYTELLTNALVPELLQRAAFGVASPAIRNVGTLGGNIGNASPAGDTLPVLLIYDATVTLQSRSQSRTVTLCDFIRDRKQIDLANDELITDICLQRKPYNRVYYHKIGSRKAMTIAKTAVAAAATIAGARIENVGIAFASLAKIPLRLADLESNLIGLSLTELKAKRSDIVQAYAAALKPIDDARSTASYRKNVTLRLIDDFLTTLLANED